MNINTGAAVIFLMYETVQSRFGAVAIHVAVGPISRGKSNCAKLAVAMVGNFPKGVVSYLTESAARSYLSGAQPFVYDDPTTDVVLKPLLMNSFGAAELITQRKMINVRCTPIVTCNEGIIEELTKADRRCVCSCTQ